MATTAGNHGGERLDRDDRLLRLTGLVFAAGLLLHNADHARRGLASVPEAVVWGGTVVLVLAAVSLTLVFTRHPAAGPVAAAVGLSTAAGVTASHLLPHWSPLSNPLADLGVGPVTWIAVLAEIGAGLAYGLAGLATMRREHVDVARG